MNPLSNPFKKKKEVLSALKDIKENNRNIICPSCGTKYPESILAEEMYVCPSCSHHFKVSSFYRIRTMVDQGSFREICSAVTAGNPLDFPGYDEKISKTRTETGLREAVLTGVGRINGIKTALCVMDNRFMMGSMGSAVGEKITRCFEYATKKKLPMVVFSASGGARMQEGILSLMQMAKTSAAVAKHSEAGLLFISVMTNPTTGGVTASFASLGDIIIGEPGALIGFAGPRVIEQTIGQTLPEGFQKSEYLLEHGFLDAVVARKDMKKTLGFLLSAHEKNERRSANGRR